MICSLMTFHNAARIKIHCEYSRDSFYSIYSISSWRSEKSRVSSITIFVQTPVPGEACSDGWWVCCPSARPIMKYAKQQIQQHSTVYFWYGRHKWRTSRSAIWAYSNIHHPFSAPPTDWFKSCNFQITHSRESGTPAIKIRKFETIYCCVVL